MTHIARNYRKIKSEKFLRDIRSGPWERVLSRCASEQELSESCALLKHFEGCLIKADGIICRLEEMKDPPKWSCISWGDGTQWFAMGNYFNIYLPIKEN